MTPRIDALSCNSLPPPRPAQLKALADTPIPTTTLGKSGLKVTRIGLGGFHMRTGGEEKGVRIIHFKPMSTQEIQTLLTRTGSGKRGPEVETYKKKAAHAAVPSTTTAAWRWAKLKDMQAKVLQSSARDLYDLDFFEWTGHDAALLRAGRFHEADVQHIAEELEDMGRRERRELLSRLRILLAHLLMWSIQPEHQSRSWRMAITHQRDEIADLLEEMPSLRASLAAGLPRIYRRAARDAVEETGLLRDPFPDACPFYLDQILDASFFL